MLTCEELVTLLTDYLDGALPERRRRSVAQHLARCEHCHEYLEQLRATIDLTARLHAADVPPAVMDDLLAAFRTWRRDS
jgi:anti-sigma factor RsiW